MRIKTLEKVEPLSEPEPKDSVRAAFVAYMARIWFTWPGMVICALLGFATYNGAWTAAGLILFGWLVLAVGAFVNVVTEKR